MDFIISIVNTPFQWLYSILVKSGTFYIWLGGIVLVLIFRYIIFPLVGSKSDIFTHVHINNKEKVQDKDK